MKILYVIDSLASKGGAERILTEKMNYLASHFDHEVTVVTCYQNIIYTPNAYELSPLVRQVCLGIPFYSQYDVGYPLRLVKKWQLHRQLVRELTIAVLQADPDILVGLSYFAADVVCGIDCPAKKIIESHDARPFTLQRQGLSRYWFSELYMKWYRRQYFRKIEQEADVVVTLTQGDALEWKLAKRVIVIPNFSIMPLAAMSTGEEKRVLAVGRLEWQKGFDRLIEAWAMIEGSYPDWRLDIFGSGTLESELKELIRQHGLQHIQINAFTPNIAEKYLESSIFVMTSRFEGFSLVLLEALQAGLPCVTFDCPFGPSDVVSDGVNGYLVPDGDVRLFAEKLSTLMNTPSTIKRFSKESAECVKVFNVDVVMEQWKKLFLELSK
jgi:glycosyltransferase involved in cell wall biosynthesis